MAFPLGGGWWFISPSTKLLLLVIIWWGSSAAFSVLSKMVLKNAVASTAVALSTLHLLMSATYFAISVAARGLDASAMVWSCLWVGMLQGLGNVSTYLLLLFSSVSRTQILKATEPLFLAVAIFSLPVNSSEKLSKWKALGFLVTVAGVILSSWHPNSKHIPHLAILSSMVANSSFGLRTVLMKMLHATQTLESSIHPVDMFGASCAVGSILSALLLCIAMLWSPSLEFKLIPEIFAQSLFPIIGSGVFFLMYNMASFALLGELSCLKWSLLKSGKLVIVVVAGVLIMNDSSHWLLWVGVGFVVLGLLLFELAESKTQESGVDLRLAFFVGVVCFSGLAVLNIWVKLPLSETHIKSTILHPATYQVGKFNLK